MGGHTGGAFEPSNLKACFLDFSHAGSPPGGVWRIYDGKHEALLDVLCIFFIREGSRERYTVLLDIVGGLADDGKRA